MAMAMFSRALSLRRANQRAKKAKSRLSCDLAMSESKGNGELSPGNTDSFHSSRVSKSIDALYVLSCVRDGVSLVDILVSDDDSHEVSMADPRLSEEKPARSSLSLNSEPPCPSEFAWDCSSSPSSSSRCSDSTAASLLPPGKPSASQCLHCDSNTGYSRDFYLVFSREQQLLSSPSPPAGVASDCCSFLKGRKSGHSEDDVRGLARKDSQREGGAGSSATAFVTRGERVRGQIRPAGIKVVDAYGRVKPKLAMREGHPDVDELQSLLKAGAMEIVHKQSRNPYVDFRESMLQTVMAACGAQSPCGEGDGPPLSSAGDVNISIEELLYCYLRLNPTELYELITQAFSDTCSDLVAMKS